MGWFWGEFALRAGRYTVSAVPKVGRLSGRPATARFWIKP
jgi:hypothetical protein